MPATRTVNPRANVYNIDVGKRSVTAVNPIEIMNDAAPMSAEAKAIDLALASALSEFANNETRLLPHALSDAFKMAVPKALTGPFRSLQQKIITTAQGNDASDARLLERPNDPSSIAQRAAIRAALPTDLQARAVALTGGDLDTLSAFLEMPGDAPEPIIAAARDRAMLLSHIRASGLQANYQRKPTAADPTAYGPDEGAAMEAATKARAWRDAQREAVTLARTTLGQVIDVVAVAADVERDEAFALLTGGAA